MGLKKQQSSKDSATEDDKQGETQVDQSGDIELGICLQGTLSVKGMRHGESLAALQLYHIRQSASEIL